MEKMNKHEKKESGSKEYKEKMMKSEPEYKTCPKCGKKSSSYKNKCC
jgi:hypothetical protein